jgi:hypothetical protein
MTPIYQQKIDALHHVRYEINSFLQLQKNWSNGELQANEVLRETVLMRRVVHFRALYEFFCGDLQNRFKDNVLDVDYAYICSFVKKSGSDNGRFNKEILHLTYSRKDDGPNKLWDLSQFSDMEKECKGFIKHVVDNATGLTVSKEELEQWKTLQQGVFILTPTQNTSSVMYPI